MESSYKENNYGNLFRALILAQKPSYVCECGVLNGYSTYHIASALNYNRCNKAIRSTFYAYDIFERYQYKHSKYEDVDLMIKSNGFDAFCSLIDCDAFRAAVAHTDEEVDFLHMDISNDGDILLKTLETWGRKISRKGVIAFEGGSVERDNGWIKQFNKRPIRPELFNNPEVYENWEVQIFEPFPSLTLLWKK